MFELSANLSDLDAAIAKLVRDLPQAQEKGLNVSAALVLSEKALQVKKTYDRPIPTSSSRRELWKRTGDFRDDQSVQVRPFERLIGGQGNSEKYEGRLARLPNGRDGINRSNPAAETAVRVATPLIGPAFTAAVKAELGL